MPSAGELLKIANKELERRLEAQGKPEHNWEDEAQFWLTAKFLEDNYMLPAPRPSDDKLLALLESFRRMSGERILSGHDTKLAEFLSEIDRLGLEGQYEQYLDSLITKLSGPDVVSRCNPIHGEPGGHEMKRMIGPCSAAFESYLLDGRGLVEDSDPQHSQDAQDFVDDFLHAHPEWAPFRDEVLGHAQLLEKFLDPSVFDEDEP
jgi:hypothetical protein